MGISGCIYRNLHRHDGGNYAICLFERATGDNGDLPDMYCEECDNNYWEDGAPKYCRYRLKQSPGVAK